jgi:hypothetical protein
MALLGERIMSDVIGAYELRKPLIEGNETTPYAAALDSSVSALQSAAQRGEYPESIAPADVDELIDLALKLERESDEIGFLKGE